MLTSNNRRVLVVDDDEQVHQLFQFCFSNKYDFHYAFSGAEALDLAEKQEFPIVLLDLNLPGESGMEILPKLRERNRLQKIIILTGHSSKQSAISAVNQGAFKYIEKPFTHAEFQEVIQEGFDRYAQEKSLTATAPPTFSELIRLGLNLREAEIACSAIQGETNLEIANHRGLSQRTVEKHFESIFSKLKINSRRKLAPQVQKLRAVTE
jgi:FixJ family two-component response regulator